MRASTSQGLITSGVSSDEPSSTMISSQSRRCCADRLSSALLMKDAWLKLGIRTETRGVIPSISPVGTVYLHLARGTYEGGALGRRLDRANGMHIVFTHELIEELDGVAPA